MWTKVKNWTNSVHAHSMTKGASSQDGLQLMLKNGAQSPATLSTVTITKGDITALGIPSSDTKYTDATQAAHGLMSAADKKKLDGVEANANHYVHPTSAAGAKASGLYKVATDAQGHVTGATAVTKADITALGIPGSQPIVPDVPEWVDNPMGSDITLDAGIAGVTDGSTVSEGMNEHGESIAANAAAIAGKQDTIADLATIRAGAAKGATAIQTETDPTVPAWAKAATKPAYKASEIANDANTTGAGLGSTVARAIELIDADLTSFDSKLSGFELTKANKNSPEFTGTPKAPTAAAGTNTTQIATTAFVQSAVVAASTGAAKYQGGMTAASYGKLTTYKAGWYWVVTEAGTIAGEACEVGDMVFCNTDHTAGTKSDAHFDIVQNNIEAIPLSVINALSSEVRNVS